MTREATGQALERMTDDEVRDSVAKGDTSGLDDLDLSEEERAMVVAAADDFPDVEGFSAFVKLGNYKLAGSFNKAVAYSYPKISFPNARG